MAREAVVGTVHKPQQPPIPEPEGWIRVVFELLDGMWHVVEPPLLPLDELNERMVGILPSSNPSRLVHIGPAPKVPVEAILHAVEALEALTTHYDDLVDRARVLGNVSRIRSWLSAQEEGGVG